ncbi:class I SAM-dependent methyltransferase [Streptomonospora sediminis]
MTEPSYADATRAAYDAVAADYAAFFTGALDAQPLDRALLAAFAERVRAAGGGPVLDAGCGPGRVTGYLASQGLAVAGLDLSAAMVELARREQPAIGFTRGSITALGIADRSLAGLVSWYSLIHLHPDDAPLALAEFGRVLAPGGFLQLAFQVGSEPLRFEEPFGHSAPLDFHRLDPDRVAEQLNGAGLQVCERTVRAPEGRETTPQAYLLARAAR